MMKVSRRTLLWLLGSGLASLGAGYAALRSFSDEDLVRLVLERYLGRLNMAEQDLQAFAMEFRQRGAWRVPNAKLADAATLLETLGLAPEARRWLPDDKSLQLESFERWLLADFYLATDFAWRSAGDDPVHFTGAEFCMNPFARFEFD
jgi:hypothetical protein